MLRTLSLLFAMLTGPVAQAQAQPTNVEVLGDLAVRCLADVPDDVATFRLATSNRMPYLQTSLAAYWLSNGYTVYLGDSTSAGPLHVLRYDPESAQVKYARADHDSLRRTIDLALSHAFVSPQGLLLRGARCSETVTDLVRAADVDRLQAAPWEEARGVIPPDRGWRTWGEPLVIGSSIAAVVYLFFSVRS